MITEVGLPEGEVLVADHVAGGGRTADSGCLRAGVMTAPRDRWGSGPPCRERPRKPTSEMECGGV